SRRRPLGDPAAQSQVAEVGHGGDDGLFLQIAAGSDAALIDLSLVGGADLGAVQVVVGESLGGFGGEQLGASQAVLAQQPFALLVGGACQGAERSFVQVFLQFDIFVCALLVGTGDLCGGQESLLIDLHQDRVGVHVLAFTEQDLIDDTGDTGGD